MFKDRKNLSSLFKKVRHLKNYPLYGMNIFPEQGLRRKRCFHHIQYLFLAFNVITIRFEQVKSKYRFNDGRCLQVANVGIYGTGLMACTGQWMFTNFKEVEIFCHLTFTEPYLETYICHVYQTEEKEQQRSTCINIFVGFSFEGRSYFIQ